MAVFDRDRWHVISPHLDRALDLPEEARAAWLASLRDTDPELATDLQTLLREYKALGEENFLESAPAALPHDAALAGRTIGAYTLRAPIGHGGMSSVWLAERSDGRFQRSVAVKFLSIALAGRGEARFRREGRFLASLSHPNIAQLMDAGVLPTGEPFLVLEHVDGEPIDAYCDRVGLDVHARIRLFLDVLAAIAHAHTHLIVHRDIKPPNVLVTAEGHVKLLDFGIAKLIDADEHSGTATRLTQEGGRALTPAYAAPEQVTGRAVTTATDVYALGVLLFALLTGRHPAQETLQSPADLFKSIVEIDPPRASECVAGKRRRVLRGDLDTILGKALKKKPEERYTTVTAFADDLRRYLRSEPIAARPDTVAYRTIKFVRRNLVAVAAAALILASLTVGLYAVNHERLIAQRRFVQVRELANKLFDIELQIRQLPGNSSARQLVVDTARDYLGRLAMEVRGDLDLALDVGTAYMRVARVQGVPIQTNLGQLEQAEQSLRTAERFIDSVLAAKPGNRTAMLRRAQIAHDRMILAGLRRPDAEALPLARQAARWLDGYLQSGAVEASEAEQLLIAMNNVGNRFRIEEEFDEALRLTGGALEIVRSISNPNVRRQRGGLLIGMARIHRDRGALDDALRDYREAVTFLEAPPGKTLTVGQTMTFTLALCEEAQVLGDTGVSLGRTDEAIARFQRAFDLLDEAVHQDAHDANSRGRLSTAGRPLANLLRPANAQRALEVYDHVLRHLGEIANNARFRRDEVRALAGSAEALQQLGRRVEARQRLDAAFSRLADLQLYPAEKIEPGAEADDVLSALAGYESANGNVHRAIEIAESLLAKISAASRDPQKRLSDAAEISRVYALLAGLYRRAEQDGQAKELDDRRAALWRHWDQKLPGNAFVRLQRAPRAPS